MAMSSSPRFDAYRKLPEGATAISAAVLLPVKFVCKVLITCTGFSAPRSPSHWQLVIVESSSLIIHMMGRVGWKATWRGPDVGRPLMVLASVNMPRDGSKRTIHLRPRLSAIGAVSYTHLTLPTNREVLISVRARSL